MFSLGKSFLFKIIERTHPTKRLPKEWIEKNEQMVLSNYNALIYVLENIGNPISEEIILDIYKIRTKCTLKEVRQESIRPFETPGTTRMT